MEFKRYQHVERIGTEKVKGLIDGKVYVFPKLDGTNTQIYLSDENEIQIGSRDNVLSDTFDNYDSFKLLSRDERFQEFFKEHSDLRLCGEWLIPHHIKSYVKTAWYKFYVFDVMRDENYLTYEEYVPLLEKYGIDYIPVLSIVENPSEDDLNNLSDKGMFLQLEGGLPEGIVIKRYDFKNKYDRTIWGKIVLSEFKRNKSLPSSYQTIEERIAFKYVTPAFVEKEYAKLINEVGDWKTELIPRFLNSIWHIFIEEESWNFIRKFKNPTIDFKKLQREVTNQIKTTKPELF